ncbi:insulinase family protein [Petralouisia muris]|uniref:Insulinase family protein n=1 Tax=Petralouisia muris TaxID=3032872 RepID=A0AC61RR81_9FIRM|nr:insulinase family protein [Petralouisia muris]TGY91479.1 insulinase family protein [Petralouisia muris]
MNLKNCSAYELLEEKNLEDIKSAGFLLKHKKSGARICLISNEDDNKVFYVGFRTPSLDSTGAAHILEHSVLCGSEKYPVKDPFVELAKCSLNTFLNAMTYPDKTIYPLASCNDKDFQNLMEVYMDAVFHPNIYKHKEIFCQEGWHYEMDEMDAPLTINGVVYNEMKGAFSSPDGVLEREILNSLYPDTSYAFESGGNPENIPELTYEQFLAFHQKYYHPSNSYIYLYGNMDMEEKLEWIDQEYLSKYKKIAVDSDIKIQKPFTEPREVVIPYNIASGEELKDNAYLSYNVSIETILDKTLYVAFDILDYALLSAPGAPLKQALLDAGIGKDIMASFDCSSLQPLFSIVAKNSNSEQKEEFLKIIQDVLKEQVRTGINRKSLMAGINSFEFRYREADYGSFPKGLLLGIKCLDSWIYDENQPFLHLEELEIIEFLKAQAETGYFEQLVQKYFLDNPHASVVIAEPQYGLNTEKEEALAKKLAEYKASLSMEEKQAVVEFTRRLKQYQEEPSAPEDLATIPMLSRDDIKKTGEKLYIREHTEDDTLVLCHDIDANGIAYFSLIFDAGKISSEEIPWLGILKAVLGYVDTASYSFQELANEINLHTGGIFSEIGIYPHAKKDSILLKYEVKIKTLYHEIPKTMEIVKEIISGSNFRKQERLYEILAQLKSRLQMSLSASGHSVSSIRAMSYFSESARYTDMVQGIEFYQLVKDLEEHFEEKKDFITSKLESLMNLIFYRDNLMFSIGAEPEGIEALEKEIPAIKAILSEHAPETSEPSLRLEKKNEGFLDASQVQYVSRAGNFKQAGYEYTGTLRILKVLLSYDYLWINIRVKGGAYGCMSGFTRRGDGYFTSYRDPNLSKTNEIYEGIPEYLENFQATEKEMTGYILGTFSSVDAPLTPAGKTGRSATAYFTGITEEMLQKEREEILHASQEDIRSLSGVVKAILKENAFCVIGNEEKLKEEKELFRELKNLY